jgi:molybdopterin-guanine dinucleotide biosynthesis protein A
VPQFTQLEGFVLVGGQSSRMGRDKALLELDGKPLLLRATDLLAPLVTSITLLGDPAKYPAFGFRILPDRWPGAGPLGAIATALGKARAPQAVVLACDLPYLTSDWLVWLFERAIKSPADIVVPESAHGLEPLCAVYRATCAGTFTEDLNRGVRKVTDAFVGLNVDRIRRNEWRQFSPDGNLFHNLNNPEDYDEVRAQSSISKRSSPE